MRTTWLTAVMSLGILCGVALESPAQDPGRGRRGKSEGAQPAAKAPPSRPAPQSRPAPTPRAAPTARPQPTPRPAPTQRAAPVQRPQPTARPQPTPRPAPTQQAAPIQRSQPTPRSFAPPAQNTAPRSAPSFTRSAPPVTRSAPPVTRSAPPVTRSAPPVTRSAPPAATQPSARPNFNNPSFNGGSNPIVRTPRPQTEAPRLPTPEVRRSNPFSPLPSGITGRPTTPSNPLSPLPSGITGRPTTPSNPGLTAPRNFPPANVDRNPGGRPSNDAARALVDEARRRFGSPEGRDRPTTLPAPVNPTIVNRPSNTLPANPGRPGSNLPGANLPGFNQPRVDQPRVDQPGIPRTNQPGLTIRNGQSPTNVAPGTSTLPGSTARPADRLPRVPVPSREQDGRPDFVRRPGDGRPDNSTNAADLRANDPRVGRPGADRDSRPDFARDNRPGQGFVRRPDFNRDGRPGSNGPQNGPVRIDPALRQAAGGALSDRSLQEFSRDRSRRFDERFRNGDFNNLARGDVARSVQLDRQLDLLRQGDVARRMDLPGRIRNGQATWAGSAVGRNRGAQAFINNGVIDNSTNINIAVGLGGRPRYAPNWYAGPGYFPSYGYYPSWGNWLGWSFGFRVSSFLDPRPYYCQPAFYAAAPAWNVWAYPQWQALPMVSSGTWIDVPAPQIAQPAVVNPGVDPALDLQLLAVRFVDPGHPEQQLGPRYRVWLRNNSPYAINDPFNVLLMAGADARAQDNLPQSGVRVTSIDAGATQAVDVRLPIDANTLLRDAAGLPRPFESLHVLVDSHRELPEVYRDNNGTVVTRSEILPVDPAVFGAEPQEDRDGSTILTLAGEGLGPAPGRVIVSVKGLELEGEVLGWYDLGVQVRVPRLPLAVATPADVVVLRGDGAAANPWNVQLGPMGVAVREF